MSKRRKKEKAEEPVIKRQSKAEEHGYIVEPKVLEWIKEKIESILLMFDETKHWSKSLEDAIKQLVLL